VSAPKLQVDAVRHDFGPTAALERIDLAVDEGEFVSVVGPSGSGKSTLFNVVSGLVDPTAGRVLIDGDDVTGTTGHVGYMLQKDLLLPWRTVVDNIVLAAALHGRVTAEDRANARALADRYGLGEFADHYPHALSGGMRQRVALMRTLAFAKDILLLDEPFGALDSQTRLRMQEFLLEVWSDLGRTIVFVTHDIDEAIFLSDRVIVLSARPGTISGEFAIDLPRPRGLEVLTSARFAEIKEPIFRLIYGETIRAVKEEEEEGEAA
jgi:ABC-type nitrate/sulfonate/bicarbonate transport system ATPase subunit